MILYDNKTYSNQNLDKILTQLNEDSLFDFDYSTLDIINELERIYKKHEDVFLQSFGDKQELDNILLKRNLTYKIQAELGHLKIMDNMIRSDRGNYFYQYYPAGRVLNISASNVSLGVLDNLINCLVTKNFSYLKLSKSNENLIKIFKEIFNDSFLGKYFLLISFKGGDQLIEKQLVDNSDLLVLWGGEDLINNYQINYPHKNIISHGPRISFSVLDFENAFNVNEIVYDYTRWNQKACSNSQVLFVFNCSNKNEFLKTLADASDELDEINDLDINEQVEILKELEYARFNAFKCGNDFYYHPKKYLIYEDDDKLFEPTALNRTLKVIFLKNISELKNIIKPYRDFLQSVSTNFNDKQRNELNRVLAMLGISRFTNLGDITKAVKGMPHEGEFALKELVNLVIDQNLSNHDNGFIYASGGTIGEPKLKSYSYGEFNNIAFKLANSYIDYIDQGATVANLFMAGGLWSSFNVIQSALEYLNLIQLPIGANLDRESLRYFLNRLRPNIIFSIPSVLYNIALYFESNNEILPLDTIFFAGEKLIDSHEKLFNKVFNNPKIRSAGYATVDFGLIGYQDNNHDRDEFVLFDDVIFDILDGELLVKIPSEDNFFHTGDIVEKLDNGFKLIGRKDKLINIWGARLSLDNINKFFPDSQILLKVVDNKEIIEVVSEKEINESTILDFYNNSYDLKNTIPNYDSFRQSLRIVKDHLILSTRTGKSLKLIDKR